MVERKLLEELGWSKELIEEITRLGNDINDITKMVTDIEETVPTFETVSGNSVHYVGGQIDTASYIEIEIKKSD